AHSRPLSCSTSRRHLDSESPRSPSCPQSPSFLLQSWHLSLMSHHAHFVSQAPGQPFALTYSAQSRYWHGLPAFSHSFMSRWLTNHCSNSQPAPMSMSITMNQPMLHLVRHDHEAVLVDFFDQVTELASVGHSLYDFLGQVIELVSVGDSL